MMKKILNLIQISNTIPFDHLGGITLRTLRALMLQCCEKEATHAQQSDAIIQD